MKKQSMSTLHTLLMIIFFSTSSHVLGAAQSNDEEYARRDREHVLIALGFDKKLNDASQDMDDTIARLTEENKQLEDERKQHEREEEAKRRSQTHLSAGQSEDLSFDEARKRLGINSDEESLCEKIHKDERTNKEDSERRKREREARTAEFRQRVENMINLIESHVATKKITLSEGLEELSNIRKAHELRISKIRERESKDSAIVEFPGGTTFNASKTVLGSFPGLICPPGNTEHYRVETIRPSVFKKIYYFFAASFVVGSDSKALTDPSRNGKHTYRLFEPTNNLFDFVKNNKEEIEAIETLHKEPIGSIIENSYELMRRGNDISTISRYINLIERTTKNAPSLSVERNENLITKQLLRAAFFNPNNDTYDTCIAFTHFYKNAKTIPPQKYEEINRIFTEISPHISCESYPKMLDMLIRQDVASYQEISNKASLARFFPTVNELRPDGYQLVERLGPGLCLLLRAFFECNPNFTRVVPYASFVNGLESKKNEADLRAHLQTLYTQYYRPPNNGPRPPLNVAFEIHNYSNQNIEFYGETKTFNEAVMSAINSRLERRMTYDEATKTMKDAFERISSGNNAIKNNAINKNIFDFILNANASDENDKSFICSVVSYLLTQDQGEQKIDTWLSTLMYESQHAYSGSNGQSCIKGIKERTITSLRSTIPDDPLLSDIFNQGEKGLMLNAKMARLSDVGFWARMLRKKGITTESTETEAQEALRSAMLSYFDDVRTNDNAQTIDLGVEALVGDEAFKSHADGSKGIWEEMFVPKLASIKNEELNFSMNH